MMTRKVYITSLETESVWSNETKSYVDKIRVRASAGTGTMISFHLDDGQKVPTLGQELEISFREDQVVTVVMSGKPS